MPGFQPRFSGQPSPSQLNTLGGKTPDPELVGDKAIKLNLAGGGETKLSGMGIATPAKVGNVSMPVSTNTTLPMNTNTTPNTGAPGTGAPVPTVKLPTSTRGTPGLGGLTSPQTSTASVLGTAAALATEDEFNPFPKTPAVIVMPEHYIFGDPGNENAPPPPAPTGSSSGPMGEREQPPPPPKSYTPPPLVSAGPVKKKISPWWLLGLAAAAYAFS